SSWIGCWSLPPSAFGETPSRSSSDGMESGGVSRWSRRRKSSCRRSGAVFVSRSGARRRLRGSSSMVWLPSHLVGNQRRPNLEVPGIRRPSAEFQDHCVYSKAIARFYVDFLYGAVDFRAQHVLHFHRLNNRHGFAGLDLLAFLHGNRNNKTRHRTKD